MSSTLIAETLPAPVMTSPLEKSCGFRLRFSFPALGHRLKNPDRAALFSTSLDIFSLSDARRSGTVECEVANQSRSHPPMSVTWNLVSDRARRIPARFFKIHKRNARAMNLKRTTTTEERATYT